MKIDLDHVMRLLDGKGIQSWMTAPKCPHKNKDRFDPLKAEYCCPITMQVPAVACKILREPKATYELSALFKISPGQNSFTSPLTRDTVSFSEVTLCQEGERRLTNMILAGMFTKTEVDSYIKHRKETATQILRETARGTDPTGFKARFHLAEASLAEFLNYVDHDKGDSKHAKEHLHHCYVHARSVMSIPASAMRKDPLLHQYKAQAAYMMATLALTGASEGQRTPPTVWYKHMNTAIEQGHTQARLAAFVYSDSLSFFRSQLHNHSVEGITPVEMADEVMAEDFDQTVYPFCIERVWSHMFSKEDHDLVRKKCKDTASGKGGGSNIEHLSSYANQCLLKHKNLLDIDYHEDDSDETRKEQIKTAPALTRAPKRRIQSWELHE